MDDIEKFLRSVPHLRERLVNVLRAISSGTMHGLDVKPLRGQKHLFRCRVGKVWILFIRQEGRNIPIDIGFRSGVYKKR